MHISKLYFYMRKEGYKTWNLRESLYILQIETVFLQFALFLCKKISGIHSKSVNFYKELIHGNVYLNFSPFYAASYDLCDIKVHCLLEQREKGFSIV